MSYFSTFTPSLTPFLLLLIYSNAVAAMPYNTNNCAGGFSNWGKSEGSLQVSISEYHLKNATGNSQVDKVDTGNSQVGGQ